MIRLDGKPGEGSGAFGPTQSGAFDVTDSNFKQHRLPTLVIPRVGGGSSTPRLLGSITDASGILVHPPEPVIRPDRLAGDDDWGARRGFAISPQVCARFELEFSAF